MVETPRSLRQANALAVAAKIVSEFKKDGWRDPNVLFDEGNTSLMIMEAGSTGIHRGYCTELGYWITETDPPDTSPSHPLLVKNLVPEAANPGEHGRVSSCDLNPVVQGLYEWGDRENTKVEIWADGSAVIYQGNHRIAVDNLGFFRDVTKVFDLAINAMPSSDLSSMLIYKSLGTGRSLPTCGWD